MAKIKGIQLKAVKSFETMDGFAISANVYLNNKKVGEIIDEGNGGGMYGHFNGPKIEEELATIVKKFYEENPRYFIIKPKNNLGWIIEFIESELLELHDIEKEFKKNSKKGFGIMLFLSTHSRMEDPFNNGIPYEGEQMVSVRVWDKKMEEMIKKDYPNFKNIRIFKSLEDFIIE